MSTPEGKLAPKNYIVSSISKNLLTPCRRVGLSRTKKTPKNAAQKSSILQKEVGKAPPEVHRITAEIVNLDVIPKRCSNVTKDQVKTKFCNNNEDRKTKNEPTKFTPKCQSSKNDIYIPEIVHANPDFKLQSKSHLKEADSQCNISCPVMDTTPTVNSSPTDSPICPPLISIVEVQVHRTTAKRNLNFNDSNESRNLVKSDDNKVLLGNASEKVYENLSLPSCTAKHILLSEPLKEQFRTNVLLEQSKKPKLSSDTVKSESINNTGQLDTKCSSSSAVDEKCNSVLKISKITVPKTTSSTTLTTFSTEDYLQEYFENPIKFQKHLEIGSSHKSVTDQVINDDSNDFMPAVCKISKGADRNYTAIAYSQVTKTEQCPDQRKEFKISKKTSKNRELTVSIEPLSNGNITKKSNGKITTNSKTMLDCSDDDMFIPSQETDRKRREKLLQIIANTEKEVKQKEQTLDSLQRAQIYKNMHSPKKLNEFSKRWIEGCKAALKDLLVKMQEHGPMEMDILIKKLRIPDDVVEKLKL